MKVNVRSPTSYPTIKITHAPDIDGPPGQYPRELSSPSADVMQAYYASPATAAVRSRARTSEGSVGKLRPVSATLN